jgi:hypothetical protein
MAIPPIVKLNWETARKCATRKNSGALSFEELIRISTVSMLEGKEKIGGCEDGEELLEEILACAESGLPLPPWVVEDLSQRLRKVKTGVNWDEAFGHNFPKRARRSKFWRDRELRVRVYLTVKQIREAEPGTPIDAGLFERVGKKLGIGKRKSVELYYEQRRSEQAFSEAQRLHGKDDPESSFWTTCFQMRRALRKPTKKHSAP